MAQVNLNQVLIDVAEYLKKNSNVSQSVLEKRSGFTTKRKISQMKLGRTSTDLSEINKVLIAYPEATQHYLSTIEKQGGNRHGYEFVLAVEKLNINGYSKRQIAEMMGMEFGELLTFVSNPDDVSQQTRDLIFATYPELNILPSFNPNETEESLAFRVLQIEKELRNLKESNRDEDILKAIEKLQRDIDDIKRE